MSHPNTYVSFETRPEKPESESIISFWHPTKSQKSHGKLAIQLSSRSGVRRDHLTPDQIRELISFLQKVMPEIDKVNEE